MKVFKGRIRITPSIYEPFELPEKKGKIGVFCRVLDESSGKYYYYTGTNPKTSRNSYCESIVEVLHEEEIS